MAREEVETQQTEPAAGATPSDIGDGASQGGEAKEDGDAPRGPLRRRLSTRTLFRIAGKAALFTAKATSFNMTAVRGVPLMRRLQTLFVLIWIFSFCVLPFIVIGLTFYLLFTGTLVLPILGYLTFIFFLDPSVKRGIRPRPISHLPLWSFIRDYFPISLRKTADVDPSRSYVFGYHPHGVLSMGALINFGTFCTGFNTLFPGVNVHVLTLAGNFNLPLLREWLLFMGMGDVSKTTCNTILCKGKGESILLVIGGAEESLDSRPGRYKLTLKHRKGFVRVALKNGASLVPVMSFGENELWNALPNPDGSFVRNMQEGMKRLVKFTVPFFYGRGVFNYYFGLMPHRRPIYTVVGEPILVDAPIDIESEQGRKKVDEYHALYCRKLRELFDRYKGEYAHGEELVLK